MVDAYQCPLWVRRAEIYGLRLRRKEDTFGWAFVPIGAMGSGEVYLRTSRYATPQGEWPEGLRDYDLKVLPREQVLDIYRRYRRYQSEHN